VTDDVNARLATLETVRLGFNAGAVAMNEGAAALNADGGDDLLALILSFNLAVTALNKAGNELKKQIGNAKGKAHVRIAFATIELNRATATQPTAWTGTVVEQQTITDVPPHASTP
jgi:hypothetical protein